MNCSQGRRRDACLAAVGVQARSSCSLTSPRVLPRPGRKRRRRRRRKEGRKGTRRPGGDSPAMLPSRRLGGGAGRIARVARRQPMGPAPDGAKGKSPPANQRRPAPASGFVWPSCGCRLASAAAEKAAEGCPLSPSCLLALSFASGRCALLASLSLFRPCCSVDRSVALFLLRLRRRLCESRLLLLLPATRPLTHSPTHPLTHSPTHPHTHTPHNTTLVIRRRAQSA
jgi:hypothetical protein